MSEAAEKYRDILAEIARLAERTVNGDALRDTYQLGGVEAPSCITKSLPPRLLIKAAEVAVGINPQNAPVLSAMMGAAGCCGWHKRSHDIGLG